MVPVYNGQQYLPSCLQALVSGQDVDCEIIVVDDCSTDETRRVVQEFGATYLKTAERSGPAAARNLGVQHARAGVVVFVDADVVLKPGSLRLIADDFRKDPELAAVFGSYDEAPAESNFVSQYKNLMHHYVHQHATEAQVSFWAGCGAIRSDIFLEAGGFDEARYPRPSIEDIELGLRLSKAGKKIRLNKTLQATHLKKWTLRRISVHRHFLPRCALDPIDPRKPYAPAKPEFGLHLASQRRFDWSVVSLLHRLTTEVCSPHGRRRLMACLVGSFCHAGVGAHHPELGSIQVVRYAPRWMVCRARSRPALALLLLQWLCLCIVHN